MLVEAISLQWNDIKWLDVMWIKLSYITSSVSMTHEPTLLHYVIKLVPRPITLPLTRTLALSSLHSKVPSKREVRVTIISNEMEHHYD